MPKKKSKKSVEDLFADQLTESGFEFRTQQMVDSTGRKWRWDFKIQRVLIDIQGGIWMAKGGHNTGKGIQNDCDKGNGAVRDGYLPLHFTTKDVKDGTAISFIQNLMKK